MKRLTYSRENMDHPWNLVSKDAEVEEALANRESRQEEGVKGLGEFTFWVRPEDCRPCLVRNEYVLEFSRLAWSRYQKTFGITHEFVNARLKGGDIGKKLLEATINGAVSKERRLLLLFKHLDDATYTIRDMVRVRDREVDARMLWDYLRDHPPRTELLDMDLVAVRFSDYAHQFRYFIPRTDDDEVGIALDVCLSMGRRLFYVQGLYWWPGDDGVIRVARLDMAEVDAKEFFVDMDLIPDAVTEVWNKLCEFRDSWGAWVLDVPKERALLNSVAILIRGFKSRNLPTWHRTPILREIHRIAAGRTTLEVAEVLSVLATAAWNNKDPEVSNRIERIIYDYASGRIVTATKHDMKDAERWAQERTPIITGGTRQLAELSSISSGAEAEGGSSS